ncbi:MAG: hypothetical protein QOF70_1182, partial [Acetobacteraceae bacterium]|nr:hypothetical protein [Acetobacteraceae bacterium]
MAAHLIHPMPFFRHEVPSLVHVALTTETIGSNIVQFRKKQMSSLNGVMRAAKRNAGNSNDLAIAAGQIIARRVALG